MKLRPNLLRFVLALSVGGGIVFSSCTPEAVQPDEGFVLYYPAITEIAPSIEPFTIMPSWYGGTPSDFSISSVSCDGKAVETTCFSVDEESGAFTIGDSRALPVGKYQISISCKVGGEYRSFKDIISLQMMKPIADGIEVTPSLITASLSDILETPDDVSLPVARITATGDNFVKITGYSIANVYLDGSLANDCKAWFELSDDGVFSIVKDNEQFEAGVYTFDFKLTTYIVDKSSEEGVFAKALTLNVTSAPTRVEYSPATQKVENGVAARTVEPFYKGSADGLKYEIKSVSPSNKPGITIDQATGVISIPASEDTQVGEIYTVSLTVTNDFGTADFDDVYSFEIIDFLDPITTFSYDDVAENISGVSFANPVKEMDGAEVIYSFKNVPDALSAITIDPATGTVSSAKGVELPVGEHTLTVVAENAKGSAEASFKITVVANPNYFTYVYWGNNLGANGTALEPIEKYGNQFRLFHDDESPLKLEILKSDIPKDRPVQFEAVKPTIASTGNTPTGSNISVQASSGRLDIYKKTSGYTTTYTMIKVTVGEGEAAITRVIPVFADLCGYVDNYQILYTPFAIRVNPKTGGVSEAPVITKKNSDGSVADVTATTSLDWRTNSYFFNLNGPQSHTWNDKIQNDSKGEYSFLAHVWNRYFTATGVTTFNAYLAGPMSWWYNDAANLQYTGGYVDHADGKKIKINPEKFKDAEGNYADGVFMGTMNFDPDGGNPVDGKDTEKQVNRVFIWFDPTYTANN
ncbi:MAG: DUF4958 domain-containing protein [Bacteroidales bacterium]|nr:DUF4958 domain-containing protein [Bacteroidales bacterium]